MELAHESSGNELRIHLPGRIDTSNAPEVGAALDRILSESKGFDTLVLDASDTGYVSSVGLRIFLRMKQKNPSFYIDNTCSDVYDVLQMTGFTEIMDVRKALREISVAGCDIIGEGFNGKVYRLNPDTIVKSYFRGNPVADIDRERRLAQKAFILGIPTAISYDVVKIKEGGYGAVFELIDADSFKKRILEHPEKLDQQVEAYCKLLEKIGSTVVDGDDLPRAKDAAYTWLEKDEAVLDPKVFAKLKSLIETIPDVNYLIHGDCHIKNIFFIGDEPLLIDMDTLARGHRIFELAPVFLTYLAYEVTAPGNSLSFLGIPFETSQKLFYRTFDGLYPNKSEEEKKEIIDKVRCVGYALLLWRVLTFEPQNAARKKQCIDNLNELTARLDTLDF